MRDRVRCERGQAGVEWLAVVGVVGAVMLAAAAGAVPGADALPRAVGAGFTRAFCLVSGGDCLRGTPRPCVVGSDERSEERRVAAAVVRLADGRRVLREERSDGSVVISVEDEAGVGGGFVLGPSVQVGGKAVKVAADVAARVHAGRGRRYVLPDAAAADRLLARLDGEGAGARGLAREAMGGSDAAADERWWAVGTDGEGDATARVLGTGFSGSAAREIVAAIRSRRTGGHTLVLSSGSEVVAALAAPLGQRLGAGLSGAWSVELALDRRGIPAALTVRGARGVQGEARVGEVKARGGNLLEAEASLDLADPAVRALAVELVRGLRAGSPGRAATAARGIGARLVDRARIDLRLYATDRTSKVKGGSVAFLLKAGYEVEEIRRTARLVEAYGREPGMGWARRLDCVGVA